MRPIFLEHPSTRVVGSSVLSEPYDTVLPLLVVNDANTPTTLTILHPACRFSHPANATTRICRACAIMMVIPASQNAVEQAELAARICLVSPSGNMTCNTAEFWDHTT